MQIGAGLNFVAGACVLVTFILFKINEWNSGAANVSSSLGMGMYFLIACALFEILAVVLAIAGMEDDDADYVEENDSFQPKGFQPGSIVNHGHGDSSYI